MKNNKKFIISRVLLPLYISVVLFLCLYNFSGGDINLSKKFLGINLDKIVHFTMFLPFPFLLWLFLEYSTSKYNKRATLFFNKFRLLIIIALGIFFAALTEAGQEYLTSYRDSDPFDMVADLIGIVTGTVILYFVRPIIKKIFE